MEHKNRDSTYKKLIEEREKAEDALLKLKQTQAHLVQNEKMASLGTLLAGVSHEINNPLNFIKGSVDVFETQFNRDFQNSSPKYAQYFHILNSGVTRISNIAKSLNHFNHQTTAFNNNCDLSQLINNCLTILNNELKNNIVVTKKLIDDIHIKGNSGQLHQVFLNIITNAIHAMEGKGSLLIETVRSNHLIYVILKDTGKGIDDQSLEKIFDPFYTTKEPGKGTGLGLSIVYRILKDHSGNIDIKSKPNQGTEVKITLPLK